MHFGCLVLLLLFFSTILHENKCNRPDMRQRDHNNVKAVIKRLKSIRLLYVPCGVWARVEC